jgi:hypothetical protein
VVAELFYFPLWKRLHIVIVTIFKEYLIVTVTTFRKYFIVTVTISKKYLIVTVTIFKEHLIVTLSKNIIEFSPCHPDYSLLVCVSQFKLICILFPTVESAKVYHCTMAKNQRKWIFNCIYVLFRFEVQS